MDLLADLTTGGDAHQHDLAVRTGFDDPPEGRVLHRQPDDVFVDRHPPLLSEVRPSAAIERVPHWLRSKQLYAAAREGRRAVLAGVVRLDASGGRSTS